MSVGIYIFRRDLRLNDNYALYELSQITSTIIPIFILDRYQIDKTNINKNYRSENAIQFMCESLVDLDNQLNNNLKLFYGNPIKIFEELLKDIKPNYVGFNLDFSRYARKRDNQIIDLCKKYNIQCITSDTDLSLIDLKKIKTYKQYGAFYKTALKEKVQEKLPETKLNIPNIKIKDTFDIKDLTKFYKENKNIVQRGGRSLGLKRINNLEETIKKYNEERDNLDFKTTNISAYLNFGCISVREFYYILPKRSELIKQLYWRDFFLQMLMKIDDAREYYHMDKRFDNIAWKNNNKEWKIMMDGKTGFLLIDAAINELKITGFIHNRMRMILGVFWTKYLLINIYHPLYGSQVGFSRYLVDCAGTSQNKLNHAWITEIDLAGRRYAPKNASLSGRPMKIGNEQIKKFDKECKYIKRWLPHLNNIPNKDIYTWNYEKFIEYNRIHPSPIFNESERYNIWIKACK